MTAILGRSSGASPVQILKLMPRPSAATLRANYRGKLLMPLNETPKTTMAKVWTFIRAIAAGVLVAVAGIAPWVILITLNARIHPELPWAACATLTYLFVLMAWLNGWGWPKGSHDFRRHSLRLWRP